MFIKVFVPNANGKIELTVQELEALLKDAADKAVAEQCAKCHKNYNWWCSTTGTTLLNNPVKEINNPVYQPTITCSDSANTAKSLSYKINDLTGETK